MPADSLSTYLRSSVLSESVDRVIVDGPNITKELKVEIVFQ